MKIDRLVGIVMVLLEKDRVAAQELACMFEVSQRTIYRDVEALCRAGIPIRSTPGTGGGFEVMPGYKVQKGVFSASDLTALVTGLTGLSGVLRSDELAGVLAKVRNLIPTEQAASIEAGAGEVVIDMSPWMGNRDVEPLVAEVRNAIRRHRPLTFAYMGIHGGAAQREVEPCQLVLKGSRWYLYGYCRLRGDFRLFRLSRISGLRALDETFQPKPHPKPRLDADAEFASIKRTITLRIHHSIADRVLDYCPQDNFTPDGNDHYLVEYPFIDRNYWYDALLGLGPECEVVAPADVRAKMAQRAREIYDLYRPDSNSSYDLS